MPSCLSIAEIALAAIVRHGIGALRLGEREYDVRHRRGAEIVAHAGYTLEIIERSRCPAMFALARQLLGELPDREQPIERQ